MPLLTCFYLSSELNCIDALSLWPCGRWGLRRRLPEHFALWGGLMVRVGGAARRSGRVWRRLVGRTAVLLVVVLGLTVAAPSQRLGRADQDLLRLSWLWDWFDLPARWAPPPVPPTPRQESAGTAGGKSHAVSAASTRAGGGAGKAPGKGVGQLDPYR